MAVEDEQNRDVCDNAVARFFQVLPENVIPAKWQKPLTGTRVIEKVPTLSRRGSRFLRGRPLLVRNDRRVLGWKVTLSAYPARMTGRGAKSVTKIR